MSRRLVAAAAATVLTIIGTVLIVAYVAGADQRAAADLEPTGVLVVTQPIPEGTPADQLPGLVALETLPRSAVAPGALSALDQLEGQVAGTDLVPGEQLVVHRFVEPEALVADAEVEVPAGMHQVTIQLNSARVLGGHLAAGDTVGIFVSLEGEAGQTHLMDHKVLVVRVQGGIAPQLPQTDPAAEPDTAPTPAPVPAESIMVTLALDAPAAEKVVYAAEYERIWLSLEDAEADESGTRVVTQENIYE